MTQAMLQPAEITATEYRQLFPEIEAGLNWERFAAERWPVEYRVVTERDELLQFFTFFRSSLGRVMPHFLHWLASRQMRMGEVLRHIEQLPPRDRATIEHFRGQWQGGSEPIALQLPTYQFGGGEHFLLDCNHRATAIALSGRPFRIELFSVTGPRERDALVDSVSCR